MSAPEPAPFSEPHAVGPTNSSGTHAAAKKNKRCLPLRLPSFASPPPHARAQHANGTLPPPPSALSDGVPHLLPGRPPGGHHRLPAASISPHAGGTSKRPLLAGDDAPWRVAATGGAAGGLRPIPRIHHAPVLRVATQDDSAAYALAVMKHPDPIGEGLAMEAVVEAAGPECIVPGQQAPLRLMGLKVCFVAGLVVD
ncbi:hypothetical protein PR202_ga09463 [Eleusine coracana subsp. coracana]|uniref:Uncharacterized protein n=1 Tax=Eleusine coracana subsp. coracana TaxID=191504 RepID=A0AAV5C2M1_ELECO|nr:hypothetical protein PR202_ga09463 [Eleusine coracana subsp. coracana]